MHIIVCSLAALDGVIGDHQPSHVVSLLSPGTMIERPPAITPERHLAVEVNDIDAPAEGLLAPEIRHARAVLDFTTAWDRGAPIAIHCYAGISRSMASAFMTLCALNPDASEAAIAGAMRSAAPFAKPNPLLVLHADTILKRSGRMVSALDGMGEPSFAAEGVPTHFTAAFDVTS